MRNDNTTFKDLYIFPSTGNDGIVGLINKTTSDKGKEKLNKFVKQPPDNFERLCEVQAHIKYWANNLDKWPAIITNGSLVMLYKFFEEADGATAPPSGFSVMFGDAYQKLFNKTEYFFTQFSLSHIADFLNGCRQLTDLLGKDELPSLLRAYLEEIQESLQHDLAEPLMNVTKETPFKEQAKLSYHVRRDMKHAIIRMVDIYAQLDAMQALSRATKEYDWTFPELLPPEQLRFEATDLTHPMLQKAAPYDITFNVEQNFLILTGANMSGKTTFMRSVGVATLLAHLGMGVPAKKMSVSFFNGIITNMHVEDDLLKGESYFLAEVKRMKMTAEKLLQDGKYLVLMDELFKGTNVHDAYECTKGVVEGLLNRSKHLKILSTHLYEVAKNFSERKDILFSYFVTNMGEGESYHFNYKLKEGISNDRIGYRILQKEGVFRGIKPTKGKLMPHSQKFIILQVLISRLCSH